MRWEIINDARITGGGQRKNPEKERLYLPEWGRAECPTKQNAAWQDKRNINSEPFPPQLNDKHSQTKRGEGSAARAKKKL